MLLASIAAEKANRVRQELSVILDQDFHGEVTCEKCPLNDNCEFVWDTYNTDGDCLAIK